MLSITEGQQIALYSENARKDTARSPAIARTTFASLPCRSARMQAVVEKARRFSGFAMPVFLSGEAGTEKRSLPFCMYNASSCRTEILSHSIVPANCPIPFTLPCLGKAD